MNKLLIVLFLSIIFPQNIVYSQNNIVSQTESKNTYVTDLDVAIKLNKETKQNIILIFSASWCVFCKTLKNDLSEIKELDNKIVCILDSDIEKKLARQFKVKSLPTSIMLDCEGNEITRITGYQKEPYKKWLESK